MESRPADHLLSTSDDDMATLWASLDLVDDCDGGVGEASAIISSVHAFLDDWEPRQEQGQPVLETQDNDSSSSSASSLPASRRRTPAQKLQDLRVEEYELSRKLEVLLHEVNQRSQLSDEGSAAQLRAASLSFWGATAKRQQQYRLESERENKRLRELVSAQTSRAKKLQQAWRRKLESIMATPFCTGSANATLQSNEPVPANTPAVFEALLEDVESVYTGLDQFLELRQHQSQQQDLNTFFEHSGSQTVPFERHVVDQAMWKAFAFGVNRQMVKFCCDLLDVTEDTIASAFHRVVCLPIVSVFLQIRLAGRKYHEAGRTVLITRAIVEPLHLKSRESMGRVFRETYVRIVTPVRSTESNCGLGPVSTVDSYISVTRENAKGIGVTQWSGWGDGHVARQMWNQAIIMRTKLLDDVLFEEARATRVM